MLTHTFQAADHSWMSSSALLLPLPSERVEVVAGVAEGVVSSDLQETKENKRNTFSSKVEVTGFNPRLDHNRRAI
jgi:hypothetical protein